MRFVGLHIFWKQRLQLVLVTIFLRPDPQEIGRQLAELEPSTTDSQQQTISRPYKEIFRNPNVILAIGTLIFLDFDTVGVVRSHLMQSHNVDN